MVNVKRTLKILSANVAVAAATLTGGPAAGAALAGFLATPQGQRLLDFQVENAAAAEGVVLEDLAMGGLVTQPTLGFTGEAGPELVVPLTGMGSMVKPKRKPSTYNRKYSAAYRRIKRSKTLKNGRMAKGFVGRAGHNRIVKMAHAEVKKKMRRKK